MRVLTVGNMYPPHHLGGYELVWQSAVDHLRAAGHGVRVLTTAHRSADVAPGGDAGQDVHRELDWYWRDHAFPALPPWRRFALERANARRFDRHLHEFAPEVVNFWAMGGMSLSLIERARVASVATACVVCDDWLIYGPTVDAWTRAFAARPRLASPVQRATGIPTRFELTHTGPALFPSETLRQTAVDAGLDPAATEVCHQGVDPNLFRAAHAPPWTWRLLYVGRIDERKGIDLALEALSVLPDEATLTIVGTGDEAYRERLAARADQRGLTRRVDFRGNRPQRALPAEYAEADVLVFPVRWMEPWGLVPLEAMATGTPVVASGRGGSGEYLRHGENCLLFDPDGGPTGLGAAIRRLADEPGLRRRLIEGGLATAKRFPHERFNSCVERLLLRAAGAT